MSSNKKRKASKDFQDISSKEARSSEDNGSSDKNGERTDKKLRTTHPASEGKGLPAHGYGMDDLAMK